MSLAKIAAAGDAPCCGKPGMPAGLVMAGDPAPCALRRRRKEEGRSAEQERVRAWRWHNALLGSSILLPSCSLHLQARMGFAMQVCCAELMVPVFVRRAS